MFSSLFCPGEIFAASSQSLSVSDVPLVIDQLQEFEAGVFFSCSNCTSDSYLRGVFYPSGSSYFGYTKDNNGNWSNATGGGCVSYYKIALSDLSKEGTWSGKLKVKPDIENAFYNGPGEYLFKVGRYTASCGSPLWSTETTITVTGPTPTPVPTNTIAPTNTPEPTNTPTPKLIPTNTPTPRLTAILTPIPTLKPSLSIQNKRIATRTGVLGESSKSVEAVQEQKTETLSARDNTLIPKVLLLVGIVFLLACVIVFSYPYIKNLRKKNTDE